MFTNSKRNATRSMRTIGFAVLTLMAAATFGVRPASANVEIISEPRLVRLSNALEEMQWQDCLAASDVEKVMQGLNSKHQSIAEKAIDVVALHHLTVAAPLLEKMFPPADIVLSDGTVLVMVSESSIIADLIAKALRSGRDPVAVMRDLLIEDHLPKSWLFVESESISVKQHMVSIVVTDEAKRLRKGDAPDPRISQLKLSPYGSKLLYYSTMKPEAVIDDIFEKNRNVTSASTDEYDLVRVLETYGEKGFSRFLAKFAAVRDLNTMTGYGIRFLLYPVVRYGLGHDLSAEQAAQANQLIARLEAQGSPDVVEHVILLKKAIERIVQKDKAAKAMQAAPGETAAP